MAVEFKTDLESILARTNVVFELGCANAKINSEAVGIDILDYEDVDVVGDIYEVLNKFTENSVDKIYSSHFMEHIDDTSRILEQLARVLKEGAVLEFVVPHFSNPYFYSDPTHRVFFGLYTMSYFASDDIYRRKVPTYQRSITYGLKSVKLGFKSARPFYGRYGFKKLIGYIVNSCVYTQELYEEMFTGIIGCYEIKYTLVKRTQGVVTQT